MNRIERWINGIYRPNPQPWKRRVLRRISLALLVLALSVAMLLYLFAELNGLWCWLFAVVGSIGMTGLWVSLWGSDFWVALFLGRP